MRNATRPVAEVSNLIKIEIPMIIYDSFFLEKGNPKTVNVEIELDTLIFVQSDVLIGVIDYIIRWE